MAQRDILQTIGDLASIGNYFKLKNINADVGYLSSTISRQNIAIENQNNLRNIVFDVKRKYENKIKLINDNYVVGCEIILIQEILRKYNITANSFHSFTDKEYFSKFNEQLELNVTQLKIDERERENKLELFKSIQIYNLLKQYLKKVISYNQNYRIQSGLKKSLKSKPHSEILENSKRFIELLNLGKKTDLYSYNLDDIIFLLKNNFLENRNTVRKIFLDHSDFSIIYPGIFNEIISESKIYENESEYYCTKCGADVVENAKYCTNCGIKLDEEAE